MQSERVLIDYYMSIEDYYFNSPNKDKAFTKIIEKSDNHLMISNFFDLETEKHIKESDKPCVIKYNQNNYYNIRYAKELNGNEIYVKFDLEGYYSAIFYTPPKMKYIKLKGDFTNLLFLGPVLNSHRNKIKKWEDNKNEKHYILIISNNFIKNHLSYEQNAQLLSTINFNDLLQTNYSKKEIYRFSFEDVKLILEEINTEEQKYDNK